MQWDRVAACAARLMNFNVKWHQRTCSTVLLAINPTGYKKRLLWAYLFVYIKFIYLKAKNPYRPVRRAQCTGTSNCTQGVVCACSDAPCDYHHRVHASVSACEQVVVQHATTRVALVANSRLPINQASGPWLIVEASSLACWLVSALVHAHAWHY